MVENIGVVVDDAPRVLLSTLAPAPLLSTVKSGFSLRGVAWQFDGDYQ